MAFVPDDLRDVSTPDLDKNYFKIVITDLELLTTYPFQFRWQYEDKTYGDWSAVKTITTIGETVGIPSKPNVDAGYGRLIITWDGNDAGGNPMTDIDRINVYINSVYYGSIFTKGFTGRLSVALASGTYSVTFKAVTKLGKESTASAATIVTFSNGVEESYTELQSKLEASGSVIANAQNQITSINTNGVTVYASTASESSGNRIVMNSEGIAGWPSGNSNNNPSFAIRINQWTHTDGSIIPAGSAFFNGTIYAQGGKLVNNLTIATHMKLGANITDPNNPSQTVDGIVINNNNYWYVGGKFKVGSSNYYLDWDTNALTIKGNITASNITGSTFTSTSYGTGTGIAIATSGNGGSILFTSAGTQKGNITVVSGGMQIVGGSSNIVLTDLATVITSSSTRVSSSNSYTSGTLGVLRNTWASTGDPSGGDDGDVWLKYE